VGKGVFAVPTNNVRNSAVGGHGVKNAFAYPMISEILMEYA